MNNILKLLLGTLSGLLVSFVFGCAVFQMLTSLNPLQGGNIFTYSSTFSKALSIGAVPNIGLFYLFLNKNNYFSARGIILSFIIIGLYVIFG